MDNKKKQTQTELEFNPSCKLTSSRLFWGVLCACLCIIRSSELEVVFAQLILFLTELTRLLS